MKTSAALSLLLVGVVACGGGGQESRGNTNTEPVIQESVADRLDSDQIAALVTLINGTEVAAAKAVRSKLVLEQSRELATTVINDHLRLMEAMPNFQGPRFPPPQAHGMQAVFKSQAHMLATLPSGTPFDASFAAIQIADHSMAIDSLRRWHDVTNDADLRRAIVAAIPVLRKHLAQAQALYAELDQGVTPEANVRRDTLAGRITPQPPADTFPPRAVPNPDSTRPLSETPE